MEVCVAQCRNGALTPSQPEQVEKDALQVRSRQARVPPGIVTSSHPERGRETGVSVTMWK